MPEFLIKLRPLADSGLNFTGMRPPTSQERAVSLKLEHLDANTARIVEDGQVVALIHTMADGRFGLYDANDHPLTHATLVNRNVALEVFLAKRKVQPHD